MKCLFLLPVRSQPRYSMMKAGVEARAVYFDRPYFKGGELPCSSQAIGYISHGNYFRRLFSLAKAFCYIIRIAKRYDILYAFGLDLAGLSVLTALKTKSKVIYEIGDITKIQQEKNLKGDIVRLIEKIIAKRTHKIVVTASDFAVEYYSKVLGLNLQRIQVIENRLDLSTSLRPRPSFHKAPNVITIGYFGLLRFKQSWTTLKLIARNGGHEIKIIVRGHPMGLSIEKDSATYKNIEYKGPYIAPDDLSLMYGDIDIVWACFDPDASVSNTWKWARTNRFYESCFFRKPMIAQSGTTEGYEVESLGIGMTLDLSNPEKAANELLKALPKDLRSWQKNAAAIPDSICVYTNEHKILLDSAIRAGVPDFTKSGST